MKQLNWALLAASGSAALLMGAWFFQYGLGMAPCPMCLWQRWPHMVAVGLGAVLWLVPAPVLALLGALAAATSGGIGVYHTGVERGWFPGPTACSGGGNLLGQSIDDILNLDQVARVVRCDEVPWEMLGLSMASWNAAFSFVLAGMWLMALRQKR